ncbi:hypothetical protein C1S80_19870 [Mycolicibacterium aubagnense]|nr:hypothetical protein C1S80_19870 [Mycolicibacterium aubagnense]
MRAAGGVGGLSVRNEVQRRAEGLFQLLPIEPSLIKLALGCGQLSGDPLLFRFELVKWHGSRVVGA